MISQLPSRSILTNPVMRSQVRLALILLFAAVLSACSSNRSASEKVQVLTEEVQVLTEEVQGLTEEVQMDETASPSLEDWTRHDAQGAVEVSVMPLNIHTEVKETIDFEISMNTHSVDLSVDLATLSTLETNLGELIRPVSWSGGSGHHVQGILIFPAQTSTGNDFLEGASNLTLIIRDVDAPAREFVWELNES